MPKAKRVEMARRESRAYMGKAEQFLEAARAASAAGQHDAAMLSAIHAAISGTDAVTIALAGVRSSDPNHLLAADLLDEVGGHQGEVSAHAKQLRQLLGKKHAVEYGSGRAPAREANDALKRADRLVTWARSVVDATKR
ncbi:MAG: HEPN domain-containing protein [Actinomycetota bacterium]